MKAMHRHGCVDSTLTQQVERLLSDAALQDYAAAFTPENNAKTRDYSSGFTPGFISKFQDYTHGFTPGNQQNQSGFTSESGVKCRELKSEKHTSLVTTESSTNRPDGSSEVTQATTGTLKKNANSPVPASPVQEHASVQATPTPVVPALKESLITNTAHVRYYRPIYNQICVDLPWLKGCRCGILTAINHYSINDNKIGSSSCLL